MSIRERFHLQRSKLAGKIEEKLWVKKKSTMKEFNLLCKIVGVDIGTLRRLVLFQLRPPVQYQAK